MPEGEGMRTFFRLVNLEKGLSASLLILFIGLGLLAAAVNQWRLADFGMLSYASTMRIVIPGAGLTAIAFQAMLSSFFVSILGMRKRV
jgi:hypothetical protein